MNERNGTYRTEIDDQTRELIDRLFHLIFFFAFLICLEIMKYILI